MGVMDKLFGGASGAETGTPSNAQPPSMTGQHAPPAQQTASATTGAATASATQVTEVPKEPANSSLDPFKDFWNTPVDAQGKPVQTADPLATPIFNLDPTKIREQASTLDFVKDIKPELLEGLVQNGNLNTAGLLELINAVQQNAFTAATLSIGNMVNSGIDGNNKRLKMALPGVINGVALNNLPAGDNPVFNHPAVQPLVHALRTAAYSKNPSARPDDVATQVNSYLTGLTTAIAESKSGAANRAAGNSADGTPVKTDWDNYFSL